MARFVTDTYSVDSIGGELPEAVLLGLQATCIIVEHADGAVTG